MDVQEKTLRAIGMPAADRPHASAPPRRALHRVETAALDLRAGVRTPDGVAQGHLLNISAGGCSVRVQLPLTLTLDAGVAFEVILPAGEGQLLCPSELVGLEMGKGAASLRLRFRSLAPETRRDLLSLIGELLTRDFQLRHTGGNRAWSVRRRE